MVVSERTELGGQLVPQGNIGQREEEGEERYLIVLDGTWKEASRLLQQNARLAAWPHCVTLPTAGGAGVGGAGAVLATEAQFTCRPPPKPGYLSTLEAVSTRRRR